MQKPQFDVSTVPDETHTANVSKVVRGAFRFRQIVLWGHTAVGFCSFIRCVNTPEVDLNNNSALLTQKNTSSLGFKHCVQNCDFIIHSSSHIPYKTNQSTIYQVSVPQSMCGFSPLLNYICLQEKAIIYQIYLRLCFNLSPITDKVNVVTVWFFRQKQLLEFSLRSGIRQMKRRWISVLFMD